MHTHCLNPINVMHRKARHNCAHIKALGALELPNSIIMRIDIKLERLIFSHAIVVTLNQYYKLSRHILAKIIFHIIRSRQKVIDRVSRHSNWVKLKGG